MRVDGRGVSPTTFEHAFDTMGVTTENETPASAQTDRGHGRTFEEFDMTDVRAEDRRRIAGDYLTRARDDFHTAARNRIRYVLLARQYGMTNDAIGALLGISERAVRGLVARHSGDA